ncbi:MAG: Gx transporter family protein [Clostridia bacterium]
MKRFAKSNNITFTAVFVAASLIMFMVESLFPPLFIPGAKMGLSNIFSLLALITLGVTQAYVVVIIKTILGAFITGSISTLTYSLPAGIIAISLSVFLFCCLNNKISIVAISVASATLHNIVQNIIYIFVSQTPQMSLYFPYLALVGVLAGAIVGISVALLQDFVNKIYFKTKRIM